MNFINFDVFPEQASTYARHVDPLFYFLTAVSAIVTVGVLLAILYLSVRFRKIEGQERASQHLENPAIEIIWTVIPMFFFLAMFVWGAKLYGDYRNAPDSAIEIDVVGKRWMWKVQHPNGVREVNDLHIPVDRPIRLNLTSQDVLHSYYVPAFRVKQDVIPGRFTSLWFEATKVGAYNLFCAEYCGTEHSMMIGKVTVLSPEDYVEWLAGGPKRSPVDAGDFIFSQRGCATCHNANPDSRGPYLEGLYGSTVQLDNGEEVLADDAYLLESIRFSGKKVVKGFSPVMPAFANQLSAEDINNLIAYIKSLGGPPVESGLAKQ